MPEFVGKELEIAALDASGILCDHNIARCMHGAAPLIWDDTLASAAQFWVNQFPASGDGFYHGGLQTSLGRVGQNMASTCGGIADIGHSAVRQWMDEEFLSSDENGHYTQVVWKGSRRVGCAVKTAPDSRYGTCGDLVCDYYPPGNYIGEEFRNVQARTQSREACQRQLMCTPTRSSAGSANGAPCPSSMDGCAGWCGGAYSAEMTTGSGGRSVTCTCKDDPENNFHGPSCTSEWIQFEL